MILSSTSSSPLFSFDKNYHISMFHKDNLPNIMNRPNINSQGVSWVVSWAVKAPKKVSLWVRISWSGGHPLTMHVPRGLVGAKTSNTSAWSRITISMSSELWNVPINLICHGLNFFHGSSILQTVKSFYEEALVVIPDFVLDSTVGEAPSGCVGTFAKLSDSLPPRYTAMEHEALCA